MNIQIENKYYLDREWLSVTDALTAFARPLVLAYDSMNSIKRQIGGL